MVGFWRESKWGGESRVFRRYVLLSGVGDPAAVHDGETAWDSVRNSVRWAVVRPPSVPTSAAFGPMSTTFQPTIANFESMALTAHFASAAGSLVTWKSIFVSVASGVL